MSWGKIDSEVENPAGVSGVMWNEVRNRNGTGLVTGARERKRRGSGSGSGSGHADAFAQRARYCTIKTELKENICIVHMDHVDVEGRGR
jgi:hypothetical protein